MPAKRQPKPKPEAEKIPVSGWTPEKAAALARESAFMKVPRTFLTPKPGKKPGTTKTTESAGPLKASGAVKHLEKLAADPYNNPARGPYTYLTSVNGVPIRLSGQEADLRDALTRNPKLAAAIGGVGNVAVALAQAANPAELAATAPSSPRSSRAERIAAADIRSLDEFAAFAKAAREAAKGVTCVKKGEKAAAGTAKAGAKTPRTAKAAHTNAEMVEKYSKLAAGKVLEVPNLTYKDMSKFVPGATAVKNFAYDPQDRIGALASAEGLAAMRNAESVLNKPGLVQRWLAQLTVGGRELVATKVGAIAQTPVVVMPTAAVLPTPAALPMVAQGRTSPQGTLSTGPSFRMP